MFLPTSSHWYVLFDIAGKSTSPLTALLETHNCSEKVSNYNMLEVLAFMIVLLCAPPLLFPLAHGRAPQIFPGGLSDPTTYKKVR